MNILIADDDPVSRRKLEFLLRKDNHNVRAVSDGEQAFEALERDAAPPLAILDIIMPGMDGVEVCQRIRRTRGDMPPYIILLTIKGSKQDVVEGLKSGANDYVVKPFDRAELRARVNVGVQMLDLHSRLTKRVLELENALSRVRHLQGLLRNDTQAYEFGPFRLEAAERRLLCGGKAVPLTAKVFDLLLLLVQNSSHLVERDEIMDEVWSDSAVEYNNLTVSMSVLRKALGESGKEEEDKYIETVPKRGYRFIAKVLRRG